MSYRYTFFFFFTKSVHFSNCQVHFKNLTLELKNHELVLESVYLSMPFSQRLPQIHLQFIKVGSSELTTKKNIHHAASQQGVRRTYYRI